MKYANLDFDGYTLELLNGRVIQNVNIGDFVEFKAIDELYEKINISKNNQIKVEMDKFCDYTGPDVIVPINFRLMIDDPKYNMYDWSENIIPVFIGVSFGTHDICDKAVAYLKKHEPIGCRDITTYNLLQKYNIISYLAGCITLSLNKINMTPNKKVGFVDVPEFISNIVPEEIKERAVFYTHEYAGKEIDKLMPSVREYTEKQLASYNSELEILVTSRYHAACYGISQGIKTIFVANNRTEKTEILESYLHVFDRSDYKNIKWDSIDVCEYENRKELIVNAAIDNINSAINGREHTLTNNQILLHNFYTSQRSGCGHTSTNNNGLLFYEKALNFIKKRWKTDDEIRVSFWGMSDTAKKIIDYLDYNYKNVNIVSIFDTFKAGQSVAILGKEYIIEKPELEKFNEEVFLFVTSNSASMIAESLGITNCFCCKIDFLKEF